MTKTYNTKCEQSGGLMTLPAATQQAVNAQQRKNRFLRYRDVLLSILIQIAFMVAWEIAVATGLIDSRVLSASSLSLRLALR